MDLTDLPLPSRCTAPVETQDAAASTSATPFAKPPTIAAPKSSAQRQREYRQRLAASRTPAESIATRISDTQRKRNYRLRKAANLALASGSLESTTASSSHSAGRSNDVQNGTQRQLTNQQHQSLAAEPGRSTSSDQIEVQQTQSSWNTKWKFSIMRFTSTFLDNEFGYTCSVCDRLWFKNDLKPITEAQLKVISDWFIKEKRQLCREEYVLVCNTCKRSLNKKSMPPLAKVNGFSYPDRPPELPPLDPISERLISPRLPFMQVRRLRHDLSYGIIGQVINVPIDVQETITCLPRQLNEDDVINVNIERNLAHKSDYISGYMSKSTIRAWLDVLQKSPLYGLYEINVDLSRLNPTMQDDIQDDPSNRIENISAENTPESEMLASRQHTMMWNVENCLHIAGHSGHEAKPLNIVYDGHAEELSFPSIYFGEPRRFKMGVSLTHYMMAASEIRRRDRRGATPQKILYVAMKILRLRMENGISNTFRNVSDTENVTRRMLEDPEFLKEYVIQNFPFMKTVPNSVQYWASRKRDLFAMIRQLGKPTMFLTISANEIRWMKLLTILLKLSNKYPGKTAKDLNTSQRCSLVSDDPVTCCIYFYRLVGSLMKMLKSKQLHNPFGKYYVKDYFLRIEFQHLGSPHAHILLWLNDDPHETVSENMPRTIKLVEELSSVARADVPNDSIYANQIHKHTFTCTKQGETTCRFGTPYWPMSTTRVLVPMPQSDRRRRTLQQKAKELRTSLSERRYACMDDFLGANSLTYALYLDIVRSTLRRPTLLFRRNFDELMTNTFNPYLAGEVNSYIDIQFILDEYSCAEYVVEYVNKSARGISNLRRELTTMMQEHPERDYTGQLKALSTKLLNAVEMSAQEAAWYLLRQPMSETSCDVVYIPTVWPTERQRYRKRRQQMDGEGIDGDSTNVWRKNIIQRYEERPESLEQVYLAEFASWYANANDFVDEEDDVPADDDEDSEGVPEAGTSRAPKEYRRRPTGRVIRYRRYDFDETDNYKREMVLLYVQFRNEMSEIVDQNNFLQLFDDNKDTIMERRSLFETNLNIENVMKELEALMISQNDDNSNLQEEESKTGIVQRLLEEDAENVDDVNQMVPQEFSVVKEHSNVMSKQQYSELARITNPEQREIIPEIVHRLHDCGDDISEAVQIFFTDPAGCGKTYTLKCLMETHNRYSQDHNLMNNVHIACASTGKAADPLDGTAMPSAFRLTTSCVTKLLSTENLQAYRNMFVGVKTVFVDEISMLSSAILQQISYRLQQITGIYDKPFGGIHVILSGDFRQLPPVMTMATPETTIKTELHADHVQTEISETAIKYEEDYTINKYDDIDIKQEAEMLEDCTNEDGNPFKNVQLHIKGEMDNEKDIRASPTEELLDVKEDLELHKDECLKDHIEIDIQEDLVSVPKEELEEGSELKEEMLLGDHTLVSYDYPNFDDGSMDSNEAAALNQVEACLQDDVDIKYEDDQFEYAHKEDYSKMNIKEESELTVTETHLISNKLINTTSTVTNTHGGFVESQTTKTLVMEIHPMTRSGKLTLSKIENPEQILPTPCDNDDYMEYQDSFQLNSITGNVLSLEQEAYGLLKAKRKKVNPDKLYTCPKCPKTYRKKYGLTKHLTVHESIEKRAMGVLKGLKTKIENRNKKIKLEEDEARLKLEEKMKKEGYECTCGQVFQRRSRMETCLRSHNLYSDTNTYPCVSCTKQFKDKEELALHRKRLHRKRFPCKFCPTDYHTRKELFKHLQIHQKVQLMEYKVISEVVKSKQKLKCFMCSKSYTELSDLKRHVMDDHKEPYSCPRCKRTFSKIIDFGNHTKTFHPEVAGQSVLDVLEAFSKLVKAWKCEECGLQFHEADKLALHQIEKHSPDVKSETQFQCTDCRRVFISQKGLTSHRRIHHSTETVEESEPVETGVMCLECRKMCKDMNALLSHMRFHSPDRKYPCKFCDFRFATPEKRKAHSEIHTGDMKYVCFICEYQCSSENRLKQHKMSLKHANIKEFLLTGKPLVEEQSTSKEKTKDVKKKKKQSESESSECSEVSCDICGEKFPSESVMLEHKQTHPFIEFPNEDKPSRIFFK